MPKVVPSVAVALIDRAFPFVGDANAHPTLDWTSGEHLAGLVAIVDAIPNALLTVPTDALAELIEARARIQAFSEKSRSLGNNARGIPADYVRTIRNIIARCPDHVVPANIATLAFIPDQAFRDALRADIASVEGSLRESDWKAATVIAGSVIEALLLWALQQAPAVDVQRAVAQLVAGGMRQPHQQLERWDLQEYTEVAAAMALIENDTAAQVRIAREFRNLIHPGRAQRLARVCDRATALAATAGLEFVVRDVTP